jgi:hypothetical protein
VNEKTDGARIARFVTGRGTPEEATETRRWVALDPARAELVHALIRVWELVRRVSCGWDVDRAWRALGLGGENEPSHVNEPLLRLHEAGAQHPAPGLGRQDVLHAHPAG